MWLIQLIYKVSTHINQWIINNKSLRKDFKIIKKFLIRKELPSGSLCQALILFTSMMLMGDGLTRKVAIMTRKEYYRKNWLVKKITLKIPRGLQISSIKSSLTNLKECLMMRFLILRIKNRKSILQIIIASTRLISLNHINQKQRNCYKNMRKNKVFVKVSLNSFPYFLKWGANITIE